jgi:quercetin dioxygenase-like cupin family protein/alkylhydroperoxidase/carboxymuconolactone decarboxylase family protein YurZ
MFKKSGLLITASVIAMLGFSSVPFAQNGQIQPLTAKQQRLIPISAFTASGDLNGLKTALNEGLDAGLTVNEIKEAIVQLYAYVGFPRALNALNTFMDVLKERQTKGVKDTEGPAGTPLAADVNKNEYGTKVQTELVGNVVTAPVYDFAPAIDQFLKEHLFADVFARGILNNIDREIVTIAALANVNGLNPQLQGHFNIGMNAGLTEQQIRALISALSTKVGKAQADSANRLFDEVMKSKSAGNSKTAGNDNYSLEPVDVVPVAVATKDNVENGGLFPLGEPVNPAWFAGKAYLQMLVVPVAPHNIGVGNVTFSPGARNNWHLHNIGQFLLVTAGGGWYQEWGKPARLLKAGDVVNIPANVKHWHGATKDSWFVHLAITPGTSEWFEPVTDEMYNNLTVVSPK